MIAKTMIVLILLSLTIALFSRDLLSLKGTIRTNDAVAMHMALTMARDYLVAASKDADNDGYNELLVPGPDSTLPPAILARVQETLGEGYNVNVRYCAYDVGVTNGVDMSYAHDSPAYANTHVMGALIGAGKNGTFETACTDTAAQSDDMMLTIAHSGVLNTRNTLGGFTRYYSGEVRLVHATDVLNLSSCYFTLSDMTSQPSVDASGNNVQEGMFGYYYTGSEAGVIAYDGTAWKKYKAK